MARNINKETLEQKIEKTEKAISRNREQYDRLTAELEDLHKKRKAIQNEEILKAISASAKSYEEILRFIQEKRIMITRRKCSDVEKQQPKRNFEALDRKIEKLQEKVAKKHQEYNTVVDELSALLDERYPERRIDRIKEALYDAYSESGRSLDEILELIQNADEWI